MSLTIKEGRFVSPIGASGCGKTTMLRIMSGLVAYDEGSVLLDGQVVRGIPSSIGFVFQEPALLPWRTVHDAACPCYDRWPPSAAPVSTAHQRRCETRTPRRMRLT